MQIDFHHAVTYVATRLGGLSHEQASTVAHAAQYVDDATNDGPLEFDDGQRYVRVTSAHKTLQMLENGDAADNRLVWVPFHFLPGNETPAAYTDAGDLIIHRMMCKPNSVVAQQMVNDCIVKQDLPFAPHRLGIALHTYADTWAHQQFVGIICDVNRLKSVQVLPDPSYVNDPVYGDLTSGATQFKEYVANHLPVGHAGAVTLPDLPFLKWSFVRENGEKVSRNNPIDFLSAVSGVFNMARRYVARNPDLPSIDLNAADLGLIQHLFETTLFIEGERRHPVWLNAIQQGQFSFGPANAAYVEQGPGSWKFAALGADPDEETGDERFHFDESFLASDWKRFHDAVQYHRLFILHELLPRFGLCAS
ncbi:DUF6765 family protein [Rhodoferax sp. GW822-FHT02A01]|uniref:DUF6765 family protein n=1 Tax=Rhodoferax sp. GW822-FHT02A01 TaxID=3141537 RepID=UPI00315DBBA3